MKSILLSKFSNSMYLKKRLLETDTMKLVKVHKKDKFWGYDPDTNTGKNMYGKLLEEVRNELKPKIKLSIQRLSIEDNISTEDLLIRRQILNFFRLLPDNFIFKIRHLTPQGGCLNNCSFCSQHSKSVLYFLDKKNLKNILSALKTRALEVAIAHQIIQHHEVQTIKIAEKFPNGLIGYKRNNKLGIIFPYFDNDILSYPYLDLYLTIMKEDFNLTTRISTIGVNNHNPLLIKMHNKINKNYTRNIESFRISFSPYPFAYRNKKFKEDFVSDVIETIDLYSNLIKEKKLKIEVRYNVFLKESFVIIDKIENLDVLVVNNYIFIGKFPKKAILEYKNRKFNIINSSNFIKLQGNNIDESNYKDIVLQYLTKELDMSNFSIEDVNLYVYENIDGKYYAINPTITQNGFFGFYIYPKTKQRKQTGYMNAERLLLNSIIKVKKEYGLKKNESFSNATIKDINKVKKAIKKRIEEYQKLDYDFYLFLKKEYFPFINNIFKIFYKSKLKPSDFFDKNLLIDTGDICNLGEGFKYYKNFVTKKNTPLTFQHEMSFGHNGKLAEESEIYGIEIKDNNIVISRNDLSNIDDNGQIIETDTYSLKNILKYNMSLGIKNNFVVGMHNG